MNRVLIKSPILPKVFEILRPTPNNAVNYGKGGSPNIPTGTGAPLPPVKPPAECKCKARAAVTSPHVTFGTSKSAPRDKIGSNCNFFEIIWLYAARDALNQ